MGEDLSMSRANMKKQLLLAALMLVALGSNAQGLTPNPSPKGRVASAGRLTILPPVGMAKSSSSRLNSDII